MLKKEEVQALLDRYLLLKTTKPAVKGKAPVNNNETLINARVSNKQLIVFRKSR